MPGQHAILAEVPQIRLQRGELILVRPTRPRTCGSRSFSSGRKCWPVRKEREAPVEQLAGGKAGGRKFRFHRGFRNVPAARVRAGGRAGLRPRAELFAAAAAFWLEQIFVGLLEIEDKFLLVRLRIMDEAAKRGESYLPQAGEDNVNGGPFFRRRKAPAGRGRRSRRSDWFMVCDFAGPRRTLNDVARSTAGLGDGDRLRRVAWDPRQNRSARRWHRRQIAAGGGAD